MSGDVGRSLGPVFIDVYDSDAFEVMQVPHAL